MKVTVVVDNNIPPGVRKPLRAEHGLSLLLEVEGRKLLFDTGQTDVVLHNLDLLGVSPSAIDAVILSHGHYDHTGGLAPLLASAKKSMPIFCHEAVFSERFSLAAGQKSRISLPYSLEELVALGAEFKFVESPTKLAADLTISGPIGRVTEYEVGDQNLYAGTTNCAQCTKDPIADDLALYYQCDQGLVVISGCAHSGIINIITQGLKLTGSQKLFGIIGGTHLGPVINEQKEETLSALEGLAPEFIAANHCTGFAMMAKLSALFGKRFIPAFVSSTIEI